MNLLSKPASPKLETDVTTDTGRVQGPPDEFGQEMAREARVWKTYVREADKWDKEMMDGRGNSLDVLLIFAALFSAISTAFVIESIGDLKPDHAELSAQTLLVMSQTLAAIANGQNVTVTTAEFKDPSDFSPSRTAVIVNILWFLSLGLSMAVSLVAMLAKDWCYKFMSGRSGQAYDQGQKRQKKWDGMERWKLGEMLTYLAGVMHLALFLFAVGLCVYLQDINPKVALVVIVVTCLATFMYAYATVLPVMDPFCPYSTPTIAILIGLKHVCLLVYKRVSEPSNKMALSISSRLDSARDTLEELLNRRVYTLEGNICSAPGSSLYGLSIAPPLFLLYAIVSTLVLIRSLLVVVVQKLPPMLRWMFNWLWSRWLSRLYSHLAKRTKSATHSEQDNASVDQTKVPMGIITSQMIGWLVANCEDSRSVDTALLALSAADGDLPHGPLAQCGVFQLLQDRLDTYFKSDGGSPLALQYYRIYGALVCAGTGGKSYFDRWTSHSDNISNVGSRVEVARNKDYWLSYLNYLRRFKQVKLLPADPKVCAVVATTIMPFCRWDYHDDEEQDVLQGISLELATFAFQQHLQPGATVLSESMLSALVLSTARYLVGSNYNIPRLRHTSVRAIPSSLLPIQLAHIFFTSHETAPEAARAAAVTLAATAFAIREYEFDSQTQPYTGGNPLERRAVDILRHYQDPELNDMNTTLTLFVFGLFELLPKISFDDKDTSAAAALPGHFSELMRRMPKLDLNHLVKIHTLPESHSFKQRYRDHAFCSLSIGRNNMMVAECFRNEANFIFQCLPLLVLRSDVELQVHVLALICLCQAESTLFQNLCLNIIDYGEPIWYFNKIEQLKWFEDDPGFFIPTERTPSDNQNMLEILCGELLESDALYAPVAAVRFGLLVATIINSFWGDADEIRSILRPLLKYRENLTGLKDGLELNAETVYSRVSKSISDGSMHDKMLHTMQNVVDFCDAGLSQRFDRERLFERLNRLKESHKEIAKAVRLAS